MKLVRFSSGGVRIYPDDISIALNPCSILCSNTFLYRLCHLAAMLPVHTAFAALSSLCLCAALPVLDLPREAMDVNKPPFPIVNVIAEGPIAEAAQVDQLRGALGARQTLLGRVDTAQKKFEASAGIELDAQNQQLDKLRQMTARVTGLA